MTELDYILLAGLWTAVAYIAGYHRGVDNTFREAVCNTYYRSAVAVAMSFLTIASRHERTQAIFDSSRDMIERAEGAGEGEQHHAIALTAKQLLRTLQFQASAAEKFVSEHTTKENQ